MPNWCGNTLTLRHEDPAMIVRAKEAFSRGEFLNEFIPVPAGLKDTTSPNRDEASAKSLKEKYGYSDWYDYCVSEWGTKWDVGDDQGINEVKDHELTVYFDSAWSPPVAAYQKLEELGFEVDAMYYEPGMCFAGMYTYGCENHYDLSEMNSEEVAETLPTVLDEAFDISAVMAEYEAEQEDEVTTWYKEGVEECKLEPHKIDKLDQK